MGDFADDPLPRVLLASEDHQDLLNVIDRLRSQGISHMIDLPQIICVGDQSSGKSSVLEAVSSGIRFPTNDSLCTRFATELILRRKPQTSVTVTIRPDASRTDSEKEALAAFKSPSTDLNDFAPIVEAAKHAMGIDDSRRRFSTDVLVIDLAGPTQPHLTLVDLPGLFCAASASQNDDDAAFVESLVLRYMKNPRSIILAIVSAKNEFNNQKVTNYARKLDPRGERTLGIITKPDTLDSGSSNERIYVDMAQNKDVKFRLGWHVLKGRNFQMRDCTNAERDESEQEFFSKGIWSLLPTAQLGICPLRPRLSRILMDHIVKELPNLLRDIEGGIEECNTRLGRLGNSRATTVEQQKHLQQASQRFFDLTTEAIRAPYRDLFFDIDVDSDETRLQKRLRAVVRSTLVEFSKEMAQRGHQYRIVDRHDAAEQFRTVSKARSRAPLPKTRTERIEHVKRLIQENCGCELPGTFNPEIIGILFKEQCRPWKHLVTSYARKLFDSAMIAVRLILADSTDPFTAEGVLCHIIQPAMENIREQINQKVVEIFRQHEFGQPITYNHYFTDNIQKVREEHRKGNLAERIKSFFGVDPFDPKNHVARNRDFDARALLDALIPSSETDMEAYACAEALFCMEAYYKSARKFFVDDFAIHVIEEQLIKKIPDIFRPDCVFGLSAETISAIARERPESVEERVRVSKKLRMLKEALNTLLSFKKHGIALDLVKDGVLRSSEASFFDSDEELGDLSDVEEAPAEKYTEPVPDAAPIEDPVERRSVPIEEDDISKLTSFPTSSKKTKRRKC